MTWLTESNALNLPCDFMFNVQPVTSPPDFRWGVLTGQECVDSIDNCYKTIVHWVRNLFKVSYGKAGKAFVLEQSRLIRSFSDNSSLESIALKASFVFPPLMLQKPSRWSKAKDHISRLERRLELWKNGSFSDLLKEGSAIHKCLRRNGPHHDNHKELNRSFPRLMFEGRIREALWLLDQADSRGQLLSLKFPYLTTWQNLIYY